MIDSDQKREGEARFLAFASAFFFLWFLALYLVFWPTGFGEREEQLTYVLFFLSAPACAAIAAKWKVIVPSPGDGWPFGRDTTSALGIVLPILIIAWGLTGIDITLYHKGYETSSFSATRFAIGVVVALVACAWTIFLCKKQPLAATQTPPAERPWARILGYGVGTLLLLSLFDINITLDTLSYDPYVGPAAAVIYGAIPLVDAFSQYGLNFLLFAAALKVLPWSMFSTTLVVAILNTAYYLTVCLIVIRMTSNRLLCFLLAVFIVMFLHSASLYNITYTPSVLAMRFLPPLLLLLALTYLPRRRWINSGTTAATALCSIWSFEALAFGSVAYATYILIAGIADRKNGLVRPALATMLLAGCIALPHILLSISYWIYLGTFPRYDIYWELLRSQATAQANWMLPVDGEIRTWALFGFAYALGLAGAMYFAWRNAGTGHHTARLALLGTLCALGIVQFSYYIGRSATPILVILAFPLAILFVLVFDEAWSSFVAPGTRTSAYRVVGVSASLLIIGMTGVFADRFFRPMTVTASNSTILRSCLSGHETRICRPDRILAKLWQKIQEPVGFPANHAGAGGWSPQENEQAYALVQKYQKDQSSILIFVTDSAAVLFFLKKQNRLGFAHSMVDGLSPTLVARARDRLDSVREGDVVILGDTSRSPADQEMVARLRDEWIFCLLEARDIVKAYALKSRKAGKCP